MNERETWDREYKDHDAIPSSHRFTASRAIRSLSPLLDHDRIGSVLDIGCGNARNTVLFARKGHDVTAIDFADAAVELARDRVSQHGLEDRVTVRQEDVMDGLGCDDGSMDTVIDSYVSCHFLEEEEQQRYWEEVRRVIADDGAVLWVGMSREDGYYSRLEDTHADPDIVVDPLNDVAKRLYGRQELEGGLHHDMRVEEVIDLSFSDAVDGETFRRRVLAGIFTF